MKKSTLITTIAMIVVVVVALSTATYAWFSSGESTNVQTTVSTQAAAGITITAYDLAVVMDSTTPTTNANVDPTSSTWTVTAGLWAPTGAISTSVDKTASVGSLASNNSVSPLPAWYSAKKNGTTVTVDNEGASATNAIDGKMLRIANNTSSAKTVQIFIVIDLGESPTTNALYSATALSFYMNNDTDTAITTGYHHCTVASATTTTSSTPVGSAGITALSDATYSNGNLTTSNFSNIGSGASGSSASTITGFTPVTLDTIGTAIGKSTSTTYALVYNTTAAITIPQGAAYNYVTFAWLDGWLAEDSARGSELSVYFYVATLTAA